MPERIDLLIEPEWVAAVAGPGGAQSGLSIAVDKGRIVAVEDARSAAQRFDAAVVQKRPKHLAIPGLVNTHCHAAMSLFRGVADDLPLESWLKDRIWPLESALVDRSFVSDGTRLAVAEMLLGGVTCFADMYYFPDVVAAVASEAGMRASVGMIALEFPTVWAHSVDEYIDKGLEVHDRYRNDPLITTDFAPHAPYSCSDATLERIRKLADELDRQIHMHVHETAQEIHESISEHGVRPLARLQELGLVTPALFAVHATQLAADEIAVLAGQGASVVHCPRANMKLASGTCPVTKLLTQGVNVALGTDGAAGNNRLDLLGEMQTAALLAKHTTADATALPAHTALTLATMGGARALGLDKTIGSIEAGKAADIVCVDLAGPAQTPVLNPVSNLVYSASRDQVADVWVAGEHLVRDHTLTRWPIEEIQSSAAAWTNRVRGCL